MSPLLPFDIIALIIDIVGENKDTNLLKELALVSHSFLQISSKHLFATVDLHDANPEFHVASSKKGFIKLFKGRPDVIKYIRQLTYKFEEGYNNSIDHLLSAILSNFLPTTSRLTSLKICAFYLDWTNLDPSVTSAFRNLMHLPTLNHIDLSSIRNFPLSSLTSSVNLLRLDIRNSSPSGGHDLGVLSEMTPKIREFHTSESTWVTTKLLHAKRHDGRPAFNFTDLRQLSISFISFEDGRNIRYLLQNAKFLEKLHLSVGLYQGLVTLGLLSSSTRTLKVLDLTLFLPLEGLCEELEAMAGHNILEALCLEVLVHASVYDHEDEEFIGPIIQNVEKVFVKPGWSALRQVSFKLKILNTFWLDDSKSFEEALQSLPDKYLSHLSKLESVTLNYSVYFD